MSIDHRVHPRIIGAKGRGIRKIMEDYKVDLKFPRPDAEDPNLVTVSGPEDAVLDCKDYLLNLTEEYVSAKLLSALLIRSIEKCYGRKISWLYFCVYEYILESLERLYLSIWFILFSWFALISLCPTPSWLPR